MMLGLSLLQFSGLIGVTYQQVYKYEHGINSISADRLYELARGSGTPIEYFFEGLDTNECQPPRGQGRLIDLMRSLTEVRNERQLEAISQLVRSLAGV